MIRFGTLRQGSRLLNSSIRYSSSRLEKLDQATIDQLNEKVQTVQSTFTENLEPASTIFTSNIDLNLFTQPMLTAYDALLQIEGVGLLLAIPVVSAAVRTILFPIQNFFTYRMQRSMIAQSTAFTKAKEARDAATTRRAYSEKEQEMMESMLKMNQSQMTSMYKILIPGLLHTSHFFALRQLAASNFAPVLATSMPWASGLAALGFGSVGLVGSDPILPALTIALMYFNLRSGVDDLDMFKKQMEMAAIDAKVLKRVAYGAALLGYVVMLNMPATVSFMMLSNAAFNFAVLTPMKRSQRFTKIFPELSPEEKAKQEKFTKAQQAFIQEMNQGMQDMNQSKSENPARKKFKHSYDTSQKDEEMDDIKRKIEELDRLLKLQERMQQEEKQRQELSRTRSSQSDR